MPYKYGTIENNKIKTKKIINLETDSIRFYSICDSCVNRIEIVGIGEVSKDIDFYIIWILTGWGKSGLFLGFSANLKLVKKQGGLAMIGSNWNRKGWQNWELEVIQKKRGKRGD